MNMNHTIKCNNMCLKDCDFQFQEHMIKFLCSFCRVIESQEEEEDSIKNLQAYVDIKSKENSASNNLILLTRNCMLGSFLPQLHRLCFRHCKNQKAGFIDNNFFSESENSALSRDSLGPRSNHKLHVSCDTIMQNSKKRHDECFLFLNPFFTSSCTTQ